MKRLFIYFFILLAFWTGTVAYGADAITFNPVPVQVYAQSGGVPVGMVVAWPVAGNPADAASWLECNGQSTVGYPELAAVIGANVPDLRGRFLRGLGGNSGALGVTQGDAIRNIVGRFNIDNTGARSSGVFHFPGVGASAGTGSGSGVMIEFNASKVVPTANENRPVNIAVRYFIRARP